MLHKTSIEYILSTTRYIQNNLNLFQLIFIWKYYLQSFTFSKYSIFMKLHWETCEKHRQIINVLQKSIKIIKIKKSMLKCNYNI